VNRIPVLPTLLTLANGVCGFAAIAYLSKIRIDDPAVDRHQVDVYFLIGAGLILAGMIFDVLDGVAARLGRCTSEFGGQLDSLCDVITFGAAPAFLMLRLGQEWRELPVVATLVAVVAALYLACAILRLARFNCENTADPAAGKRFRGLPSPAAAGCVASLAVLRSDLAASWLGLGSPAVQQFATVWAPLGTLAAALLMVSRFSYPHLSKQLMRGRGRFPLIVQAVLAVAIFAVVPHLAFFLLFWAYALFSPLRYLVAQTRRRPHPEGTPRLD
jgi:CDP-diacylglycerol--serine O-phosphatidyltransferase